MHYDEPITTPIQKGQQTVKPKTTTELLYVAQIKSGAFGVGLSGGNDVSISGYEDLERFLVRHADEIRIGAPIVDARKLPYDVCLHESCSGPIVNPRIDEDEYPVTGMSYVTPNTAALRWHAAGARVGHWTGSEVAWQENLNTKENV